ncbi:serine hydrolase domain-containing protein [uncultured Paraglaciecola sp.]|uniref:serine hydrolase domain-containing protein n=1 Tax=uncultured Paraglaciecola sp. TaxID=1765024 RepID=UPI0030DA7ABA|tara:strand:+ start:130370 stop:132079 length:1710 start_codon:yes stop_codon:yes gene_type:complete
MRLILLVVLLNISFSAFPAKLTKILNSETFLPDTPLPLSLFTPQPQKTEVTIKQGSTSILANAKMSMLVNTSTGEKVTDGRQIFPDITFDWVQNNSGEIIPTIRHLVISDNPYWDYILGVGKMLQDNSGQESNKVSMPFTLIEKNENCSHNGVLVFDNQAAQGHAYFQISSETCAYFKADFWGRGNVTNTPLKNLKQQAVITAYAKEKSNRVKTKPIKALTEQANPIQIEKLALASSIAATDMTLYGLLVDDVHYVSECQTRAGNYPFCEQLVLPSYSTAKTLFAATAMLYLEQQYGDVFSQKISSWVKQCSGDDWQEVTFSHLLDMSTGHYQSSKYSADEASPKKLTFFNAKTNNEKLAFACGFYSRKSQAGKTFVYHTSDTYLLGAGLTAYVKDKLGEQTNLFNNVLYEKIFKPLGLSQVASQSRRTTDLDNQAYVGYGLFFTRDDLVRLSRFVSQQASANEESRLLAKAPLQAALQQNPKARGLTTDYSFIRYQHGFWARQVSANNVCPNTQWIPFMSGYGGITVALLAKSSIYYYVSDSFHFDWSDAIPELEKLNLICSRATVDT